MMECYGYPVHSLIIGTAKSYDDRKNNGKPAFYYLNSKERFWDFMPFRKNDSQNFNPCDWEEFVDSTGIGFADLAYNRIFKTTEEENQQIGTYFEGLKDFFNWLDMEQLKNIGLVGRMAAKRFFLAYDYRERLDSLNATDFKGNKLNRYFDDKFSLNPFPFGEVPSEYIEENCRVFILPHVVGRMRNEFEAFQNEWTNFYNACQEIQGSN